MTNAVTWYGTSEGTASGSREHPREPAPGQVAREVAGVAGDCVTAAARLRRPALAGRPDAVAGLVAVLADIGVRLSAVTEVLVGAAWQAEVSAQDRARERDAGFAAGLAAAGQRSHAARNRSRQLVGDAHWLEAQTALTLQRSREARESRQRRLRSVPPPP